MTYVIALLLLLLLALVGLDRYVAGSGHRHIVEPFQAAPGQTVIVPGAKVNADLSPTDMLQDRLDTALALYVADRTRTILVSGDGRPQSHDETGVMAAYLTAAGVPAAQILVDPAGYDTFQTITRAKHVFGLTSAIMTTQTFHLERALFIAERIGFPMTGVAADLRSYETLPLMRLREVLARAKAFYECSVFRSPE